VVTRQWLSSQFSAQAVGSGWTGSQLAQGNKALMSVPAGRTIVRTRWQCQVLCGIQNSAPSTVLTGGYIMGGNSFVAGVYFDKTKSGAYTPADPTGSPEDGNWLSTAQLQLTGISSVTNSTPLELFWTTYQLDADSVNSFAERGPNANATNVYLTWRFFNALELTWTVNSGNRLGLISMSSYVKVLTEF
jgi:hypothetical protein